MDPVTVIAQIDADHFRVTQEQTALETVYSLTELKAQLATVQAKNAELADIRVWRDSLSAAQQQYVMDYPDIDTATLEALIEALESYGSSI